MGREETRSRPTRRTRIVCVSDTHNFTVKLPKGDVLIHAGDLSNQGSYSELSKAVQWLEKADFEAKIVIAGNHDITLDHDFYSKHASSFHSQDPQDPAKCRSLFTSSRTITYLQHSSVTVRLRRPDGPRTQFTVFGSPYSPQHGTWAFMYPRSEEKLDTEADRPRGASAGPSAAELWSAIPQTTDILVTHTPPATHCDDLRGCEELRKTLARVRPRLHVCGHVHQARGAQRVRWQTDGLSGDGDGDGDVAAEVAVGQWADPSPDPASAKISLVDLTARGGKRPLDFHESGGRGGEIDSTPGPDEPGLSPESTARATPLDRTGRRETCVVNCAIVATSWPHTGGRRFHKPIVVDIDLPVWE